MLDIAPEFVRQIADLLPAFAGDVRYTGPHPEVFADSLKIRKHTRVHVETGGGEERAYDGFVAFLTARHEADLAAVGKELSRTLSPCGYAMLVCIPDAAPPSLETLAEALAGSQLAIYRQREIAVSGGPQDGAGYIAYVVHSDYNPVLHARELLQTGHAGWAFDVLVHIPEELLVDPLTRAHVAAEKQVCLLAWDRSAGDGRLERFHHSQAVFYDAVSHAPTAHDVYLCQGEFWRRLGDEDMRSRLLRSVLHAAPFPELARSMSDEQGAAPIAGDMEVPTWKAPDRLPRVLFVTHPRPHYGLDVLYDGLCTVLGEEQVVDFPHKPTLHGVKPESLAHYPCMFSRRGVAYSIHQILDLLRAHQFDLVLWGDLEGYIDPPTARAIAEAAGSVPIALVDQQDDAVDHWNRMRSFIGRLDIHFKREMIASWDYGSQTVPLPFAYADQRVPEWQDAARTEDLFWAGHRQFGLRRLYLEHIEQRFGLALSRVYTQEEYAAALSNARVGLNIFGFGFDTVRYWEVPAQGAMLLAERLPIRIPHNFVDGESAIFFDDLAELEKKLAYCFSHPDECGAIARRGYDHLKRYHTASARAQQLLGWVQAHGLFTA